MSEYDLLCRRLDALTRGIPHRIANLANAAALLYHGMEEVNWAGFYLAENGILVLGPFQGQPACIEIPPGKGVCGSAFVQEKTLLVPDVHSFPGHIACDTASCSEIVIPLHVKGKIVGVMDIDSPVKNRFQQEDREGLEEFASIVEAAW